MARLFSFDFFFRFFVLLQQSSRLLRFVRGEHGQRTRASVLLVLILLVAGVITFYDLNGHSLDPTDREVLLIVTDSMDGGPTDHPIPTIPVNSLVMVKHLEGDSLSEIEIGDVLAFRSLGIVITHRVVDIDPDARTFTTKGDNASSSETVPFDNVVGKVVGVNPWLGQFVAFVKASPFLVIAGVLLLMVMVYAIGNILRISKEKEN